MNIGKMGLSFLLGAVTAVASGQEWVDAGRLWASDSHTGGGFGCAVAAEGDLIVVGSNNEGPYDPDAVGTAYIFRRIDGAWIETATLTDNETDANFSRTVSISNGVLAIGTWAGVHSVWIFEQVSGAWTQTARLEAPDGPIDGFANQVAIDGNTIVVGAYGDDQQAVNAGSAYVFERVDGVWGFSAKLTAPDGAARDIFGWSVDIDGDVIVIGARDCDDLAEKSGAIYVFEKTDGAWIQTAKLLGPDALAGSLGHSVAIDAGIIVAGATTDSHAASGAGAGYVFEKVTGVWTQTAAMYPPATWLLSFGQSVAIDADTAVISGNSSSYYTAIYARNGDGTWTRQRTWTNEDGFGDGLAIDGRLLVIGARWTSHLGQESCGSVWLYEAVGGPCPPDMNFDGVLNFFDVQTFLQAFAAQEPLADFTGDGEHNFFDVQAFLQAFAAGCP